MMFCEVDLVILLFCIEGFGLVVLEVIFVGFFVFVFDEFGIVDVLEKVEGGYFVIVELDDVGKWV